MTTTTPGRPRRLPRPTAHARATYGTRLGPRQKQSIARSTCRVNLWEGSIRAGKTLVSFLRFLGAIAEWQGGGSIVMVGKSRDSLYRNVFEPIERDPWLAWLRPAVKYRQGATNARILGVKVAVLGANDAAAFAKIRGMTVGLAYGDEVSVWAESMFKELLGRMSPAGAALYATTNPDNPGHWLHEYLERWLAGELPEWYVTHFTMDDNPGLTDAYKDAVRAEYTGLWFKRMILGLWVAAEGAIYADWDTDRHVIDWGVLPPLQRVLAVGVDYGTSHASSAVLLAITDEHDPTTGKPAPRLIAVDEWRHDSAASQIRLTDVAQARALAAWLASPHTPAEQSGRADVTLPEYLFRDPAAASLGEQWYADTGDQMWLADNDVLAGIADVANLLHTGRLLVTTRCEGIIKEAPAYVWDAKATQRGEDKPVKRSDDSLDALRYAVRSTKYLWAPIMAAAYGLTA